MLNIISESDNTSIYYYQITIYFKLFLFEKSRTFRKIVITFARIIKTITYGMRISVIVHTLNHHVMTINSSAYLWRKHFLLIKFDSSMIFIIRCLRNVVIFKSLNHEVPYFFDRNQLIKAFVFKLLTYFNFVPYDKIFNYQNIHIKKIVLYMH